MIQNPVIFVLHDRVLTRFASLSCRVFRCKAPIIKPITINPLLCTSPLGFLLLRPFDLRYQKQLSYHLQMLTTSLPQITTGSLAYRATLSSLKPLSNDSSTKSAGDPRPLLELNLPSRVAPSLRGEMKGPVPTQVERKQARREVELARRRCRRRAIALWTLMATACTRKLRNSERNELQAYLRWMTGRLTLSSGLGYKNTSAPLILCDRFNSISGFFSFQDLISLLFYHTVKGDGKILCSC